MKVFQKFTVTILLNGETRSLDIDKNSFTIGRSSEADVKIKDELLSRQHLKVCFSDEKIFLEELSTSNGTWLDNEKLKSKEKTEYNPQSKITLGKKNGPVIQINVHTTISAKNNIASSEEVTLVRRNPLLDQKAETNNVIVMRTEVKSTEVLSAPVIKKVANGTSFVSSESLPTSPSTNKQESPDLISKMKNLLNFEAENTLKKAKLEAEKILSEAKEKSSEIKKKSDIENKKEQKKVNLEILKLKEDASKTIEELLLDANRNSQDIIETALAEAQVTKKQANEYSSKVKSEIEFSNNQKINETNNLIKQNLEEYQEQEKEIQKNIKSLEKKHGDLKSKVDILKITELSAKENYDNLTRSIEREELRMNSERESLASLRTQINKSQSECDIQLEELRIEEKKFKAQMESDLIDQKLKISQIQLEYQQTQSQKEILLTETYALQNEIEQSKKLIHDYTHEQNELFKSLQITKNEFNSEHIRFTELKSDIKKSEEEINKKHSDLNSSIEELKKEQIRIENLTNAANLEVSNCNEHVKKELEYIRTQKDAATRLLEEEAVNLKKRKEEIAIEIEAEKLKLKLELTEDLKKLKEKHENEIQKIIDQKILLTKNFNETKLEQEDAVKKATLDFNNFKNSLKVENDKLKAAAQQEYLATKDKLDQLKNSALLSHEENKKAFFNEMKNFEKEKSNIQKSIQNLKIDHDKKLKDLSLEIKQERQKADHAIESIKLETEQEIISQNTILDKQKQDALIELQELKDKETSEIQIMKESAMKDIYGKKNERAKAVTMSIDIVVLDELNKYRKKRINDEFINEFTKNISEIAYETLMNRYNPEKNKLDQAKKDAEIKLQRTLYIKKQLKRIFFASFICASLWGSMKVYTAKEFSPYRSTIEQKAIEYSKEIIKVIKEKSSF